MPQPQRRAVPPTEMSGLAARAVALDIVSAVLRRGRALDDERPDLNALPVRDRGFARAIAAVTLRRLGQIDAVIQAFVERPIPPRDALATDLLRVSLAQLLFLGTPPHAAVDTAVELVRARGKERMAGLVNAVLRRTTRDGQGIVAQQDAARLNTPDWLWQRWVAAYGEEATRAIALQHLEEPPLDITAKGDPSDWAVPLEAEILPQGTLRRTAGGNVTELPGFDDGAWWVQDAAATLPVKLFGDLRGKFAVDLCSAPGGKTMQIAAAGAEVVAVDLNAKRLDRVRENLERVGLRAKLVEAEGATWRPAKPADAVLLDAPCSATGTIRRHPDILWLKTPDDVQRLTRTQDKLLANAATMLAPGGVLVYAVCSLQPEEGVERIEALLRAKPELKRAPVTPEEIGGLAEAITPEGDLRTLPSHWSARGGMDGFYAARLTKG